MFTSYLSAALSHASGQSTAGKLSVAKSMAFVGTGSVPPCSVWQRFWAVDDDVVDDDGADDGRDGGGGGDGDAVSLCILFVMVAAAEAVAPLPNLHVSSEANVSLWPE